MSQTIDDFYIGEWVPRIGKPWQVVAVDGSTVRVLPHFTRGSDPVPMPMAEFDRWRDATGAVKHG